MRSRNDQFTRPNAFSAEFLRRLGEEDQPPNTEAEVAGPWRLVEIAEGWACVAEGDERPAVVAREREVALLAAAALPPSGRPPRFSLKDGPEPPFELLDLTRSADPAGKVACWNADLVAAMNALDGILRSPVSLAFLLEAAGAEMLALAGGLLAARVAEQGRGGTTSASDPGGAGE